MKERYLTMKVSEPLDVGLRRVQDEIGEWQQREFRPDGTPANFLIDTMIVTEEVGETARCYVKRNQNIRGGSEHWGNELRKEQADVVITVLALCANHQIDLMSTLAELSGPNLDFTSPYAEMGSPEDVSLRSGLHLSEVAGRLSRLARLDPESSHEWWTEQVAIRCSYIIDTTMKIATAEGFDWFEALLDRWGEVSTRRFATNKGAED
jgi:NTP pyrophosphatase (non-canonical NTP hydrolase)